MEIMTGIKEYYKDNKDLIKQGIIETLLQTCPLLETIRVMRVPIDAGIVIEKIRGKRRQCKIDQLFFRRDYAWEPPNDIKAMDTIRGAKSMAAVLNRKLKPDSTLYLRGDLGFFQGETEDCIYILRIWQDMAIIN